MKPRLCRICDRELIDLYFNCSDRHDAFYVCGCGAVNPLRRPPGKQAPQHLNEWISIPEDAVSIKDVPVRLVHGGYHIDRQTIKVEEESFV